MNHTRFKSGLPALTKDASWRIRGGAFWIRLISLAIVTALALLVTAQPVSADPDVTDGPDDTNTNTQAATSPCGTPYTGSPPSTTGAAGAATGTAPTDGWQAPVYNSSITAGFGNYPTRAGFHSGADWQAAVGTDVHAINAGTVKAIQLFKNADGTYYSYGRLLKIDHGGGIESWYAHLSSVSVAVGDTVTAGQVVAKSGALGNVTGPHLHLEVHVNGTAVDPIKFLKDKGADPLGGGADGPTSDPSLDQSEKSAIGMVQAVVAQAAITSLCFTLNMLHVGTSPQFSSGSGNTWFGAMFTMFRGIGLWVVIPILLLATIHAVFKGSMNQLLKTYFVFLPVAVIGGVAAVGIVQLLLNVTDDFSESFINSISANAVQAFTGISQGFGSGQANLAVPAFVTIFAGVILLISCISVYVILVLRESAVYIATAFIPLGLAFFVWPSTSHFFKRIAEFLFAMIFSKLIMIAGIALAVAAMVGITSANSGTVNADGGAVGTGTGTGTGTGAGSGGVNTGTANAGTEPWYEWLGQDMTVTVLFIIIAFSPRLMVKVLSEVSGQNGGGRAAADNSAPPAMSRHLVFIDRNVTTLQTVGRIGQTNKAIKEKTALMRTTSQIDQSLGMLGVTRGKDGSYAITQEAVDEAGITDVAMKDFIKDASQSQDANLISAAHHAFAFGADDVKYDSMGNWVFTNHGANGGQGEVLIVGNVVDPKNGRLTNGMDPKLARRVVEAQIENGQPNVRLVVPYDGAIQDGDHAKAYLAGYGSQGAQLQNAHAIEEELAKVNIKHGSRAHIIVNATTTREDMANARGHAVGQGAGVHDF